MTVEGADVAQLRAAAAQFSRGASALETSSKALHSLIGSATQWRGPDADRFRSQWSGQSTRTVTAAVEALRQAADTLRHNATQQDDASKVNTSDSAAGRTYDAPQAPKGTEGLFKEILVEQKLAKTNSNTSGVRVQQVVGADGTTRFIVYLDGTFAGQDMTLLDNLSAMKGYVVPDIYDRINAALTAAGDRPGPNGPPIMLVGFSQGGMDAQNIAASGRYHVTNVVTYGSPLTQPDNPSIATVHLQAKGDNVPGMGPIGIGIDNAINVAEHGGLIGGLQAVSDTSNYVARTSTPSDWIFESDPCIAPNGVLGNHGETTYQDVAADFDKSTDPHFDAVKQSMQKFDGTIISSS